MDESPGSKALQNMKSLSNSLVEFKKPTIPKKRNKPKILTEEKYIEELSKIIQRDFFPDLDKLRAQNDYLDALEKNDHVKMQEIRSKYSGKQFSERSRSMTPATFETPQINPTGSSPTHHRPPSVSDTPKSTQSSSSSEPRSLSTSHTLDSFLQAYTSEDNYSFQEIIETADEKLREKFSVLYNQEFLSADKLARALTLPNIETQFSEADPQRSIETWSYRNKNYIMYIPEGVELTEDEKIENINRRQVISHSNTRLSMNPFNESRNKETMSEIIKTQSQMVNGKVGVDGNIMNLKNVPSVGGFDLVKTPSPRPGEAFSPLMTWGEIEGTPFRLDGSDTPVRSNNGPSFRINENSRRETIALALAEKVGEKMRAQKQRAMDTARKNIGSPFIRSSMDRLASMSPAARRLATSKLGLRTPSPLRTPAAPFGKQKTKTTPLLIGQRRKTPIGSASASSEASRAPDLTDDLLKIPTKRLNASDFF
ncbi:splicing factor ESS-2 homolog [Episyrphus balteatus]|uniref:splicing factor ESS-2 homolog n=1 Tax=Episyrphus balteatus TaxID=286459 RepID=UPI002486729C|nr:splicing factor ESS-2 homolog [Episyrphus balteatus]